MLRERNTLMARLLNCTPKGTHESINDENKIDKNENYYLHYIVYLKTQKKGIS